MRREIRRWLATAGRRRALHAVASALLRALWRRNWVPGDAAANEPSGAARRVRHLWLDTLPEPPDPSVATTADSVSVLIPVGPNDVDVVPLVVAGLRAHLRDPIGSITILTPPDLAGRLAAELLDVAVVDETSVLSESELAAVHAGTRPHRAGWYLQQLLKLKWCLERSGSLTYVLDADTVLVRPQRLHTSRGDVLFMAEEFHRPYFDHLSRLFGGEFRRPLFATTAHQMLYRRGWLVAMVAHIERLNPCRTWVEAIVDAIAPEELSGFSEGECYGQWIMRYRRRDVVVRPFLNTAASRRDALSNREGRSAAAIVVELAQAYGNRYDSVSLHYYIDDDPLPEWRRKGLQS